MGAARRSDGTVASEWEPPEIPPHRYAACVYCTAPVNISKDVDQAVVEAIVAVAEALGEMPAADVVKALDDCISEMMEDIRGDLDESLVVKRMRDMRYNAMGVRNEKGSRTTKVNRKPRQE